MNQHIKAALVESADAVTRLSRDEAALAAIEQSELSMVNIGTVHTFTQVLGSTNPEAGLTALAQQLKSDGLSQVEIYLLFEHFILLTDRVGPEESRAALGCVGGRVWGWGGTLFKNLLTEDEVETYRKSLNRDSNRDSGSDASQLNLFSEQGYSRIR